MSPKKPVVYKVTCGGCGTVRYLTQRPANPFRCRACRRAAAPPPPKPPAQPAAPPVSRDPFYSDAARRQEIDEGRAGLGAWLPKKPGWLER